MSDKLYLDEDFRMLSKTYPADVSAIGVTTLIDYVEALEAELQSRIAELEAAQRWIPVSERLPEEFTPVLTFSKDNDKPVTAILAAGFWWSNVDWALNVTHWMSLPQPPEVK